MDKLLKETIDLYTIGIDHLERYTDAFGCLFFTSQNLNRQLSRELGKTTVFGWYFKNLIEQINIVSNTETLKSYPIPYSRLFRLMKKYSELYNKRKTEFETFNYNEYNQQKTDERFMLINYCALMDRCASYTLQNFKDIGANVEDLNRLESKIQTMNKPQQTNDIEPEKQIYLLGALSEITADNVEQIFDKLYSEWRFNNSNNVNIDGQKVESNIEKFLLRLPDKDGNPNMKHCTVSDTVGGINLTLDMFINEQLRKNEPLYTKSIGSELNRVQNAKLKIYIDYLKKRQNGILTPEYFINNEILSKVHNTYNGTLWDNIIYTDFLALFDINNANNKVLKAKGSEGQNLVYLFMRILQKEKFTQKYIESLIPNFKANKSKINNRIHKAPTRKKEIDALF